MRILVVEDDKDVTNFVVQGLREAGHVVEHAATGRDGLFLATSETFDAIASSNCFATKRTRCPS